VVALCSHPATERPGGATLHLPTRLPLTCPTTDHTHREEELLDDSSALLLNTGALVDGSYRIVAVDNNGVATTTATARHWPIVLITAPVDRVLGGKNLYAHPFPRGRANPIRALIFADPDDCRGLSATIFLDDREAGQMQRVSNDETHRLNSLWQGTYDATALGPGEHKITVRAECQRAAMFVKLLEAPCNEQLPPKLKKFIGKKAKRADGFLKKADEAAAKAREKVAEDKHKASKRQEKKVKKLRTRAARALRAILTKVKKSKQVSPDCKIAVEQLVEERWHVAEGSVFAEY